MIRSLIIIISLCFSTNVFSQFSNVVIRDSIILSNTNTQVFYYDDINPYVKTQLLNETIKDSSIIMDTSIKVSFNRLQDELNAFMKRRYEALVKKGDEVDLMMFGTQNYPFKEYGFQVILININDEIRHFVVVNHIKDFPKWKEQFVIQSDGGNSYEIYGVLPRN